MKVSLFNLAVVNPSTSHIIKIFASQAGKKLCAFTQALYSHGQILRNAHTGDKNLTLLLRIPGFLLVILSVFVVIVCFFMFCQF